MIIVYVFAGIGVIATGGTIGILCWWILAGPCKVEKGDENE